MASKNRRSSGKPRRSMRPSISYLSSWSLRGVLVAVVAASVTTYVFRDPAGDALTTAKNNVMDTLGLGVVPVALWLATMIWILIARRRWLQRANIWLSAVVFVALTLGIMAFFQPSDGVLAEFTLDGDVSLGGAVGDAITGSVVWLGVLRLIGVGLLGVAVAAPPLAVDVGVRLGRLGLSAYMLLVVGIQSIGRMYRVDRPPRPAQTEPRSGLRDSPSMMERATVEPSGGEMPFTAPGTSYAMATSTDQPEGLLPDEPTHSIPEAADSARPDAGDTSQDIFARAANSKASAEVAEQGDQGATTIGRPASIRTNRLWESHDAKPNGEPSSAAIAPRTPSIPSPREAAIAALGKTAATGWSRPSIELLKSAPEGGVTDEEIRETADTIRRTLGEYRVEVEIGEVRPGPTVTLYGLIPGWVRRYKNVKETDESGRPKLDAAGKPVVSQVEDKTRVKVDNILSREKDLALALKTPSIRIETPVMGQSLVGIEVPNPHPSLVTLRSVMESDEFAGLGPGASLPIALGKATGGEPVVIDLVKMPHLLIAGATGSGKSVCINAIISCLLLSKTPAELRLLLIDPKRVELSPYNGIPHLLTPVVVETDRVVALLKGLIHEMMDRYRRMEDVGVRNIKAYNDRMPDKMPFIVAAVDELADLMITASFDVEQSLCRLAQLGRATGIHLIVATQRPSVDVVTGLIKANFPSRISFGVASQVDSRTILDSTGAEKLLGRGDMLYLPLDAARPIRAQNVFISDREIETLVTFWQTTPRAETQSIRLRPVDSDSDEEDELGADGDDSRDELFDKVIQLAQSYSKLSTSLLQRRLRIGYPRAARLMDQLEEQGIVGPSDGSKSRDVIINQG